MNFGLLELRRHLSIRSKVEVSLLGPSNARRAGAHEHADTICAKARLELLDCVEYSVLLEAEPRKPVVPAFEMT